MAGQIIRGTPERQKLGALTIACLILNRTIGSGIFVLPAVIREGMGSTGAALVLWAVAAIVAMARLLVWLELGLTIPRYPGYGSVPRSGGDKNYLESVYHRPRLLATCLYGLLFVVFGNLAGNAVAFGSYVMLAAGHQAGDPARFHAIRGLAVAVLTVVCLLHAITRKGALWLNNILAVMKVAILLLTIVVGFAAMGGASFGKGPVRTGGLSPSTSFVGRPKGLASVVSSFLYALYPFGGFEQPFYVLSEVAHPHRIFARTTIITVAGVGVLFFLINVVYLGVVPMSEQMNSELDIATDFFAAVFKTEVATRVMAGIISLSIFGNIFVMTYTAARVKQEIAKEGILPFWSFFARNKTTLAAALLARMRKGQEGEDEKDLEESPSPALILHWVFSVLLVAVTAGLRPTAAYSILVSTFSYFHVLLAGFFVGLASLWKRFRGGSEWVDGLRFKPWGGSLSAFIYCGVSGFILITLFLRPDDDSPFSYEQQGVWWYIVPTVGLGGLLLASLYFVGIRYVIPYAWGRHLHTVRVPHIDDASDGVVVQTGETVKVKWVVQPPHEPDHEML